MNDFSMHKRLFLAVIISGLMAVFWYFFGEPWEVLGDATWYVRMTHGEAAPVPFGYRILTPALARLLPLPPEISFTLLTMSCLVLITPILICYGSDEQKSILLSGMITAFWITSFAFIYYSTTIVRADGPTLFLLALLFYLSKKNSSWLLLCLLLALGIAAHETVLIFLVALWLDKLLQGSLTRANRYPVWQLTAMTILSIVFCLCIHATIPVLPAQEHNYISSGLCKMMTIVVHQNGGLLIQGMRIYSAYGPALLFALLVCIGWLARNDALAFLLLLLAASCSTFLAIDTLRVMAVVYLPVFYYAAQFVYRTFISGQKLKACLCMASQIAYAGIVFGHLRTFESSVLLNGLAVLVSLFALLLGFMCLRDSRISSPGRF